MLGILSGLILLIFSFYIVYMGSVTGNNWIRILGLIIGLGAGILIAISRLKLNINTLDKYKDALRKLSEHPEDLKLKEIAYNTGVNYYKNKRDNRKLLPMDFDAINKDIHRAINHK